MFYIIIFLIDYKRDEERPMDIEMNSIGTTNNSEKHSVNSFACPRERI